MPMTFHTSITGQTQGNITEGCGELQGRENEVLCQALEYLVSIPRDPQSGLPTGKRMHGPVTITKYFDKSSPKIFQALVTGERLSEVKMRFFRIDPAGKEEHYYTITLTNAIIVSLRDWVPNILDPSHGNFRDMQDVAFTFQDIVQTWEPDGIEAQDSWIVPAGS